MSSLESNVEIEVKLPVHDLPATMDLLAAEGFQIVKPRVFELNILYDRNGILRERGQMLRLRQVGGDSILTFKGRSEDGRHKVREELEIEISNFLTCDTIFHHLDFRQIFRYEKYRTEFHRPEDVGLAMLDETPIGTYLELEGPPGWIDSTAAAIGYTERDYITVSYGTLYLRFCSDKGLVPADMVFSA